jgi:hypothetical protein
VKPEAEKLGPAVAQIAAKYPPEAVTLYLSTLLCQDPDTWGGLSELAEVRAIDHAESPKA